MTQSTSSAAATQQRKIRGIAPVHCRACSPWSKAWPCREGEIYEARVISGEVAQGMEILLHDILMAYPNLPCETCLRPACPGETAKEGAYVLSFRFFEHDRNLLKGAFAPDVFEVMSGDYASGLGLPIRRTRPPQAQQASAASA